MSTEDESSDESECALAPGFDLSKQNVLELSQTVPKTEKLVRIKDWVNIQSSIQVKEYFDILEYEDQIKESKRTKRKHSDGDSDGSIGPPPPKHKREKNFTVHMDCEWTGCRFSTIEYKEFQKHVKKHIPELIIKEYEDGKSVYVCLWDLCKFETSDSKEITRHIHYHTYHTKIKSFGKTFQEEFYIKNCGADSTLRNKIPIFSGDFLCKWAGCNLAFNNIQNYFDHIQSHGLGTEDENDGFVCGWIGCKHRTTKAVFMQGHVKTHSREKRIACFHCGTAFTTKSKFRDHCERQTTENLEFKCSICAKYFFSERLLRNHLRYHNRSIKCQFCDISVTTPAVLGRHIRSAHIQEKHYKCHICDFASSRDCELQIHISHHTKTAKPWRGLGERRIYACHICDNEYSRGNALTVHLIRKHGYYIPTGATRFKYTQSEEGVYRLTTPQSEINTEIKPSTKEKVKITDANYQVIQCPPTNSDPTSFIVLPSDQEPDKIQDYLTIDETIINKFEDAFDSNFEYTDDNSKSCKSFQNKKRKTRRTMPKKKAPIKTKIKSEIDEPTEAIYSTISIIECRKPKIEKIEDDASVIKDIDGEESLLAETKNIEISIADVDYLGNILKTEVVKS